MRDDPISSRRHAPAAALRSQATTPYTPRYVAPRRKKNQAPDDALPLIGQEGESALPTPKATNSSSLAETNSSNPPTLDPNVDDILHRLEAVVRELESGELSLERALIRFEDGVKLARQGSAVLQAVEQRVEILLSEGEQTIPFASQDGSDS